MGWDQQATERPTSFMRVTKCAGVIVVKLGDHRQLARPLSVVQQPYLLALDVPAACLTGLTSGEGEGGMTAARLSPLQKRILRWWAADHRRTQGRGKSSHKELVR